ncbi:hypothetical protein [uncultured Thiohalocapsa sp.]|uniref:hypothetical protein n=1 Tax=uncultured Thiohalocapsa sp. TaxID=768990 RepID=UPI0025EED5C8|nr:hypothetical protein [uncultured Thiohalocapsa sp.]
MGSGPGTSTAERAPTITPTLDHHPAERHHPPTSGCAASVLKTTMPLSGYVKVDVIEIAQFQEEFVIFFGGTPKRINAYTLASTLVSIADAVKSANAAVNPGYDVEVVVEALGEGSFKAKIRTLYTEARNLFSKDNLKAVALSVIASYVYQHTLAPDAPVNVIVNEQEVIIEQGDTKVIVPREVHEAVKAAEKIDSFKRSIGKAFDAVEKDKYVESLAFTPSMDDLWPLISIPRARFALISNPPEIEDNQRSVIELADLHILRAILERGTRKWEFVWRGVKISAPVLDQAFYNDFFAHKIKIAPGDSISAKLRIYQVRDEDTGIFTNCKYEVIEVISHISRMTQEAIDV